MKNRHWSLILLFAVLLFACVTDNSSKAQESQKDRFYYAVPIDAQKGILRDGVFKRKRYPILGLSYWNGIQDKRGIPVAHQNVGFPYYVIIADDEGTFFCVKMPQLRIVEHGKDELYSFRSFFVSIDGTGFRKKNAYKVVGITPQTREELVEAPRLLLINDDEQLNWIAITACKFTGIEAD